MDQIQCGGEGRYEQCPKISFKWLYTLKGLLVWVEKASFSKEFRSKFHSGGEGSLVRFENVLGQKFMRLEMVIGIQNEIFD